MNAQQPQNQPPLLTPEAFMNQVGEPLVTINLSKPLPAFVLQKHYKRFTKRVSERCDSFIGKAYARPKLPSIPVFASIAFVMDHAVDPTRVCFQLRDMYCMGVLSDDDILYQVGRANNTRRITDNAIFLGIGETYGQLLALGAAPAPPPVQVNKQAFIDAYYRFRELGTPAQDNARVAFGIGITALGFMEPCRQAALVGMPGRHHGSEAYAGVVRGGPVWQVLQSWEDNSLSAEGMREAQNGNLAWTEDKSELLRAQKEVLIIKSNPRVPAGPRPNHMRDTDYSADD
nr:uncharacterized protein LOC123497166 [Aegilops tauschii subsp. strangulata]